MASRRPYATDATEEIGGDSDRLSSDNSQSEKMPPKEQHITVEALQEFSEKHATTAEEGEPLAPIDDLEYVMDKVDTLTIEECRAFIVQLLEDHKWDYNFSAAQRRKLEGLLEGPAEGERVEDWELQIKSETAINKYYSPYPEVRAVTTPEDDPEIPCETIRAHLLGYIWAVIGQFINSFFNSRFPAITFQSAVAQILLYPCGLILAWVLPDWGFTMGGKRHSLNPGPWTYKEQMLSTIIVDVGLTSAYVFWNIQTQTVYYHDTWLTPGYKILLLLATQLMGLGFAGLLRRFAIYPTEAIWPNILPTVALNRALLVPSKQETIHGWTWSRYKFFFIFFAGMFIYFWIPSVLFGGLSYFAWMTWIAPNNFNLAVVTGSTLGLGFNPISSFDWNVFATVSFPLTYPFFSFIQQYIGTVLGGLIILGLYYSNVKWTSYLPPNTSGIFDNTGQSYNISRVVTNGVLDEAAYKAYSPAFYGAGNLVVYGAFFTFYTLTFVFVILDFWRPITKAYRQVFSAAWLQVKRVFVSLKSAGSALVRGKFGEGFNHLIHALDDPTSVYDGFDDPFTRMMRNYAEVPDWWFLAIVVASFIFSIILLTQYPDLNTPVWTIFFVIGLNVVFLVPMTYLYAISGTTEGLNVVTELIVGYALPGHPEALMFVKAFGYNINGQADNYISDQKMGLYAKIPPRAMYRGQLLSSIITAFVAYGVVQFVDNDVQGICTPNQPQHFSCANGSNVYFSASVIWGAIGPKRIFGQIYPALKYCFLLGFLLALVWWSAKRVGGQVREWLRARLPAAIFAPLNMVVLTPLSWLRSVHPSLIVNGMLFWAPLNLTYFNTGLYFSIFFMYYLRRYKTAWWEKYNYILAAALNGGVAFAGVIIFFAVQFHPKVVDWWGNNIVENGVDGFAGQTALLTQLPAKGHFGPDTWE